MALRLGWDVPPASASMQPSTTSTPASAACTAVATPTPVLSWLCRCIGRWVASFRALTSSFAAAGLSRPAMSLMARMCAPAASISRARST